MKQYILPVATVIAYSLIPNHFHLLIRTKSETEISELISSQKKQQNTSDFIMQQFSNWFNSYAKAYNKMYNRKGTLFMDFVKRNKAETDDDITSFIFYIHKNAVHHGLCKQIGEWKYHSYSSVISAKQTSLGRTFHINWFGSKEQFIKLHLQSVGLKQKDL